MGKFKNDLIDKMDEDRVIYNTDDNVYEDAPLRSFKVDVKWTGTIASFNVVAYDSHEAVKIANKKLDMESNGLIHFDTQEIMEWRIQK